MGTPTPLLQTYLKNPQITSYELNILLFFACFFRAGHWLRLPAEGLFAFFPLACSHWARWLSSACCASGDLKQLSQSPQRQFQLTFSRKNFMIPKRRQPFVSVQYLTSENNEFFSSFCTCCNCLSSVLSFLMCAYWSPLLQQR